MRRRLPSPTSITKTNDLPKKFMDGGRYSASSRDGTTCKSISEPGRSASANAGIHKRSGALPVAYRKSRTCHWSAKILYRRILGLVETMVWVDRSDLDRNRGEWKR